MRNRRPEPPQQKKAAYSDHFHHDVDVIRNKFGIFTTNCDNDVRAKILNASAGSGKTYQLAYKYVFDVLNCDNGHGGFDPGGYRRIVAVTFTNKATEEMKSRILKRIHELASGEKSEYLGSLMRDTGLPEEELRRRAARVRSAILHDYSRFTILTNDTFFQRILRAFVKELGMELNYSLELDADPIIARSADALIEEMADNAELRSWIMDLARDRIESGERWNIRDGIKLLQRELFKEFSKEPIEHAGDKQQLKRLVFGYCAATDRESEALSRRCAEALKRIADAGYTVGDFQKGLMAAFERCAAGDFAMPTPSKWAMLHGEASGWFTKAKKASAEMVEFAAGIQPEMCSIADEIAKVTGMRETKRLLLQNYRAFALLNDLYRKSVEICREENSLILSETKNIISAFITENDAPFIYEKVGNRFERYMIDEFQDTSLGEWRNFLPLLRNAMAQSADVSVLLVGDIKQSIYRWRGSDWSILGTTAPEELGRGNTEIRTLDSNFRSLPQIVEFNNDIFGRIVQTDNAALNGMLDEGLEKRAIGRSLHSSLRDVLARAYAGHRQHPMRKCVNRGYVNITAYDEGPDVAGCVKRVLDLGFRPCDITVIIRDRKEGVKVARELLAVKEEGDPRYRFEVTTQEGLKINGSPAVSLILSLFRLAVNRRDRISLAIYNRYRKGCDFRKGLSDEDNALLDTLRSMSPEEAFERVLTEFPDISVGQTAYVQALHEQIVRYCSNRTADLKMLLEWWDENGGGKSVCVERNESSIDIMTIHKAKGLENRVIIIPYCKWELNPRSRSGEIKTTIWTEPSHGSGLDGLGRFPVTFGSGMAESAFAEGYYEETVQSHVDAVNLLYVAFTRASEQLYVFVPEKSLKEGRCSNVGDLLCNAIGSENFTANSDGAMSFECGVPQPPEPSSGKEDEKRTRKILTGYVSRPAAMRLRLKSERYSPDGGPSSLSPRDEGIAMHRIFENAASRGEIESAIRQSVTDGLLSEAEARSLNGRIMRTLDGSVAGEWFDGSWETVRCENDIIVPGKGLLRPDRVMIRGRKAVVVDYKFGGRRESYGRQVAEYARLLRDMGYGEVDGYIWYVRTGEIAKIV